MKTFYNDLDVRFTIEDVHFSALNFVFEKFLRSIPSHSHSDNSYEIHYIPYGRGQAKIDRKLYEITPNTLFVTGPHVEHEQVPLKEDPMMEYCIYFKIEKKEPHQNRRGKDSYIRLFEKTKFWFGQDRHNLHPLMQQIFYELENQYTGYMTQVETLLQQLVVQLIRNYENKPESSGILRSPNLTDSSYLIIEESFLYDYRELSLEILSKRLGLGPRQTERLLKQHYGKTFLQKIAEAKMSAAAILMRDPGRRVTDIAMELGYSSVEHFSGAFRKYYHETPRSYIAKLKQA